MGQPKASKPEVPGSTPGRSCFSLVFIKNLIHDKSKHKKKNVTICFVLSGAPHSHLQVNDFLRGPFVSDIIISVIQ